MSMFRTTNPMLNERIFDRRAAWGDGRVMPSDRRTTMTLQGAVNASAILLTLCIIAGVATWILFQQQPALLIPGLVIALGLGFVLTLVTRFKPAASPFVGPVIAVSEGIFAGTLSLLWSSYAQNATGKLASLGTGLVLQAGLLTACIAAAMLVLYTSRIIKVTEKFKLGVYAAIAGVCFVSLASMVLGLLGVHVPYLWDNGLIGLAFSGFVVVVASLNLVLDFDFIEQGAEARLPRHMEWYAGVGLLVSLVWLYVSMLRLLAMLQSRD